MPKQGAFILNSNVNCKSKRGKRGTKKIYPVIAKHREIYNNLVNAPLNPKPICKVAPTIREPEIPKAPGVININRNIIEVDLTIEQALEERIIAHREEVQLRGEVVSNVGFTDHYDSDSASIIEIEID